MKQRDDDALLGEIAAAPDDPAPYLVYADALLEHGDPRGDLIIVQHALESADAVAACELRRREAQLFEAHRRAWLGGADAHRNELAVRWRFGFVHAARAANAPSLAALLDAPGAGNALAGLDAPVGAIDELAARWPAGLRRLRIDGRGPVSAILDRAAAQLDALDVDAFAFADLATTRAWPRLVRLRVRALHADQLALVTPARFPAVRELALVDSEHTAAIADKLARLPIAKQLAALDLSGGTLARAAPLRDLGMALDVRRNRLPKPERAALGKRGARVEPQRARGDVYAIAQAALERGSSTPAQIRRTLARIDAIDPDAGESWRDRLVRRLPPREELVERLAIVAASEHDRHDAAAILQRIGELHDELGELHAAETWLWRAVVAARWRGQVYAEHGALARIGTLRLRRGDAAVASPLLERVLRYYETGGHAHEAACARRHLGNCAFVTSDFARAEAHYRHARKAFRAAKDRANEAATTSELASVAWSRQDYAGAEKLLRASIAMSGERSLGTASSYANLGAILHAAGRVAEARAAAEHALRLFDELRHALGAGQALSMLGELAQRNGELDLARAHVDEALRRFRACGARRDLGIALGNASRIALDAGEWARARALCEEAIAVHREVGNRYNEGMQLLGLVDVALGERRYGDVPGIAAAARVPLVAIAAWPAVSATHLRLAFERVLARDPAAAEAPLARAVADAERGNYPELVGWADLWRGLARAHDRATATPFVERAATRIADVTAHGRDAIAMARAVIARLAGDGAPLPDARSFDARIIARVGV